MINNNNISIIKKSNNYIMKIYIVKKIYKKINKLINLKIQNMV